MLILYANTEVLKKELVMIVFNYLIKMDFFGILATSKQELSMIRWNIPNHLINFY